MKYKLNNNDLIKENESITEFFLRTRGIEDPMAYINVDKSAEIPYQHLKDIDVAVTVLLETINHQAHIGIIVDADVDGFCSASILYQYIVKVLKYSKALVHLFFHDGKGHGITDELEIPEGLDLLIIPDAGTNQINKIRKIRANGTDVIVLDHHEIERKNKWAVIVNPNLSPDYPNKYLSGAGVVYKFLKALDDETWNSGADDYIDLVALSIISDSMSLHELENRQLINRGLANIKNKFLQALIEKQDYHLKGVIDIIGLQFYVVPLINAMIRAGEPEIIKRMFRAFAEFDETFEYKKRGTKIPISEPIYDNVARLCTNIKNKQNREIDKSLEKLMPIIEEKGWDKHQIMFVDGDLVDKNYTGLVAMKLASHYNKPCLLIREKGNQFSGSGRNVDCDIPDLKELLKATDMFDWMEGHPNAFGVTIKKEKIRPAIDILNKELENVDFSKTYNVDYVLTPEDITPELILEMAGTKKYYGHGIDEMMLVVNGIELDPVDIDVIGSNGRTLKFEVNGVGFLKFWCTEEEINDLTSELKSVKINVMGKPSINYYLEYENPQVIITEIERV